MRVGKDRFLIKVKIPVGGYFGMEPEEGFIELREPGNEDFFKLKDAAKEGDKALFDAFGKVFDALIVDHNFEHEEGGALTVPEVVGLIQDRPILFLDIVDQYSREVLFTQGKKSAGR